MKTIAVVGLGAETRGKRHFERRSHREISQPAGMETKIPEFRVKANRPPRIITGGQNFLTAGIRLLARSNQDFKIYR